MMKKVLAMAAAAALAAGVSVSAANPFSDVSTSDWAYQAVADLSDQGLVDGYPDGTFRGQVNVTRYEMAQLVARMMAKQDQYTQEQRALVDRLAAEYADELDTLGVRVSNLEKKVGNLTWGGDARMRYISNDNSASESWTGRVRVTMKGQVNDRTTVNARFSSDNVNWKSSTGGDVGMEVLNVKHDFGDWDVTLGRYSFLLGNQTGWLYGSSWGFDGAELNAYLGPVDLKVGYGQFNTARSGSEYIDNKDTFYAMANVDLDVVDVYANYVANQETRYDVDYELWGVGVDVPVGDFGVYGEYWKNSAAPSGYADDAWNVGVRYGQRDLNKVGSFVAYLAYMDVGSGVYLGGSGWQTDMLSTLALAGGGTGTYDEVKFWNFLAEVVVMPNVYLHGEYAFAADGKGAAGDPDDTWTLSLNYVF